MTAQDDYQAALKTITDLETKSAKRVSARPAAFTVCEIFKKYAGSIAPPMIEDLKKGTWKTWENWKLGGAIEYLSAYGTSDAVPPLRDIEQNYPVTDIQIQAKALADLLATLDVAVSEAKQTPQVQDVIKSGDADQMARAMLLALAQIDPDWPVRASAIQKDLYRLSADSFPAINEMAAGKLSQADVTKALVEILFQQFLALKKQP
tara:strand:- start:114 stop:731 length:618 start_codon:yes stop_codon:yes gene_type:complete